MLCHIRLSKGVFTIMLYPSMENPVELGYQHVAQRL